MSFWRCWPTSCVIRWCLFVMPWSYGSAVTQERKRETESQMIMDRQLQKMVQLVDDLLDVARITRGVIVLKKATVDLVQVVKQAVEGTRPNFETRQHKITSSLPKAGVFVEGDVIRLEQVVSNLLVNAAKYTEPGGHIAVTLECEADNAIIRVIDNGVGISPELLPYIFDLFVQANRSLDSWRRSLAPSLSGHAHVSRSPAV